MSDDFLVLILLIFGGLRYFFIIFAERCKSGLYLGLTWLNSFQATGMPFLQNKLSLRGAE